MKLNEDPRCLCCGYISFRLLPPDEDITCVYKYGYVDFSLVCLISLFMSTFVLACVLTLLFVARILQF